MRGTPYPDTDWQDLVSLLDPSVVEVPEDQQFWEKVQSWLIVWLINRCCSQPWLNHLALGVVAETTSGLLHPGQSAVVVDRFLVWAIPDYFSDRPYIKYPAMLYASIVRARVRSSLYAFMPEIAVAKWLKGRDFNVNAGRREPQWRPEQVAAATAGAEA